MSDFKSNWKMFWKIIGECMLRSLMPGFMFFAANLVMLMVYGKEVSLSGVIGWTVACAIVGLIYNGFMVWVTGASHYEMLVSGNMKRRSAMQMGTELNINSYKFQKEYRPWKGFLIGFFIAVPVIIGGIILGLFQDEYVIAMTIKDAKLDKGIGIAIIIADIISGWALMGFQVACVKGVNVSCYLSIIFAILPIIVSGVFYICGAYAKRNKTLRQQELAARAAEEALNKPKKVNYGGIPGTKPRKRK